MGNKIPKSWFDEDPEWQMLRQKAENKTVSKKLKQQMAAQKPRIREERPEPRARATRQDTDKEVVVNLKIALPKFSPPNFKELYGRHKKHAVIAVGVMAGTALVVVASKVLTAGHTDSQVRKPISAQEQAEAAFNPLLPLANLTDASGQRSQPKYTYDQKRKVLGYSTEYNGANMIISQQPLPEKFKSNPAELAEVAKTVSANTQLQTQKGPAYIRTDEKAKIQTAVFASKEVLVFVQADKKLDEDEWAFYINQLTPSR